MFRAFFFAVGLFTTLLGAVTVCVDRIVLTDYAGNRLREAAAERFASTAEGDPSPWRFHFTADRDAASDSREVIDPPDWLAFALLSAGGVTLLYGIALPGRHPEPEDDHEWQH